MIELDQALLKEARTLSNGELLQRTGKPQHITFEDDPQLEMPVDRNGQPRQWEIGEEVYYFKPDENGEVLRLFALEIGSISGGVEPMEHMFVSCSKIPGGPSIGNYPATTLRKVLPPPLERQVALVALRERVEMLDAKQELTPSEQRERDALNLRFMQLLNNKL